MSEDWTPTDTLTDWFVRRDEGDGYTAPELCPPYLGGRSERRKKSVTTSIIAAVKGRLVRTRSGSVYRLGRIHQEYRAWMRKNGHTYNAKQPIVVRSFAETAAADGYDVAMERYLRADAREARR